MPREMNSLETKRRTEVLAQPIKSSSSASLHFYLAYAAPGLKTNTQIASGLPHSHHLDFQDVPVKGKRGCMMLACVFHAQHVYPIEGRDARELVVVK